LTSRNRWPQGNISVCFDALDDGVLSVEQQIAMTKFPARVQQLVEATWQRVANINFFHWGSCTWKTNLRLEFSVQGNPWAGPGFPGIDQQQLIRLPVSASDAEILYYFGKAIGFSNEYELERQPGPCVRCENDEGCSGLESRKTCLPSGYCGRTSDHASIMAAPDCGGIESIRALSPWDIKGAHRAYGPKPVGALVAANGRCLALSDNGVWNDLCFGFDNDALRLTTTQGGAAYEEFASAYLPWDLCVRRLPNGNVSSVGCELDVGEGFAMSNTRLRGLGGLCVVATSNSAGAPLATALCGTEPKLERWEVSPSEIRLAGTSLCATSANPIPDVDTSVVLQECGTAPELQTVRMRDGRIRLQWLCFDVRGGFPIPGSTIVLWNSCPWDLDNDEFYFSGAVTSKSKDYCLTVDPSNGAITAPSCNDSVDQEWDYHF
jgi:hypothetical protein